MKKNSNIKVYKKNSDKSQSIFLKKKGPIVVGTGLFALDVVINGDPNLNPKLLAGGSCGNVLTILSYLGWKSYPIARLGNDIAAKEIKDDLQKFNVKLDFVENDENVCTPIIVEKICMHRNGMPTHRFLWVCPNCGKWLPRYRAVLVKTGRCLISKIPNAKLFYFDRVSPGALELASNAKKQGALIVFEPPSINNKDLFNKAVQLSHVVKYTYKRANCLEKLFIKSLPILIVETLGAEGLRYRYKSSRRKRPKRWKSLPAFQVNNFRDAAGSGDWCTAGMLHLIGKNGANGLKKLSENCIVEALQFGQALAALNCRFEGARGGMYVLSKKEFKKTINDVLNRHMEQESLPESISKESSELIRCICPNC